MLSESRSLSLADAQKAQEERLQRWRNAYQVYRMRLATFQGTQISFEEQLRLQQDHHQELLEEQESLEHHKRTTAQRQVL